jgi:predicted dehydrogenase
MSTNRRAFLAAAGAALTTSLFTGKVKGANDRVAVGFIGVGRMGNANLEAAMKENISVASVCDVYQPHLERTVAVARRQGYDPKSVQDFRDVLGDKSIDAVCIATPDHWHPLMTVEACKAGKDVYVEKPVCTRVNEAPIMVQAARKYKRVVQVGTQTRSAGHMPTVRDIVRKGRLGTVTAARTWTYDHEPREGIGSPADGAPPPGLDWDMWLGPAPARPFNHNRFQVERGGWSAFRYFWDYAGGQMTDIGIHIIDLLHMAFDETAPRSVNAFARKGYLEDNRQTPDTMLVTYDYPEFLMTFELRLGNDQSMFGKTSGILVYGSAATLYFGRAGYYQLYPEHQPEPLQANPLGELPAFSEEAERRRLQAAAEPPPQPQRPPEFPPAQAPEASENQAFEPTVTHWANFLDCIRTRQRPVADIEYGARSTVTCLLGNVSYRAGIRVDWNPDTWTSPQKEAQPFMEFHYREPWKLTV